MKQFLFLCTILLVTCMSACQSTNTRAAKKIKSVSYRNLAEKIETIINEIDPDVNIGVKIQSLHTKRVVFERNSTRHFIPASTQKLLTLAAALHYLGPSYRFETSLWTDRVEKNGVIKNLYIKGSGDPGLKDHDLFNLAFELKQMGIKKIDGHIYVDDQVFDNVLWGKGAMWDDRRFGYSAPVSGLNLNYNRIVLKTVPAYSAKESAHTIISPPTNFIQVKSEVRTTSSSYSPSLSLLVNSEKDEEESWSIISNEGLNQGDTIVVKGRTSLTSAPVYRLLAVKEPSMLAATYLKERIVGLGIKFDGLISKSILPENSYKLAFHQSRSLSEALIDFTKISNNVANDSMIKAIAAQNGHSPATFSAGLHLVKTFLKENVGLDIGSFVAADGAGTSRYNLITPEQMVQLLDYATNQFALGPEFVAALPIAGRDGTLGTRLQRDKTIGNIRAKTGSMSGVSSLAGYLINDYGEQFAFAIMINGFIGRPSKYLKMQDEILAAMYDPKKPRLANVK